MRLHKTLLTILLSSQCIFIHSVSADARNHDAISPLQFGADETTERFLPRLEIDSGCRPYTAVDADGNYNAGLKDSGSESGECEDQDKQQVYTRSKQVNANTYAIMYAYYFPKDNGFIIPSIGHRHDWEHAVVFVRNINEANEAIVGAAYSAHGGVSSTRTPNKAGDQVYVSYGYNGSVTHSLEEGSGGTNDQHVLISWDNLPSASKTTLNNQSFGSAVVPLKDTTDRFNSLIEQARESLGISNTF